MRARVPRISAKNAVPTVVATEVCEGNKNFAGICDYPRLEPFFCGAGSGEQASKSPRAAGQKSTRGLARDRRSVLCRGKIGCQRARLDLNGVAQDASVFSQQVEVPPNQPMVAKSYYESS
jgi:hypothetical protein